MRAIHAQGKGGYGWPRMHKALPAGSIRTGEARARRLMLQYGIKTKTNRKVMVSTDSRHSLPVTLDHQCDAVGATLVRGTAPEGRVIVGLRITQFRGKV